MKPTSYDSFQIEGSRLTVTIPVPETIEEYDSLAGKTGACLQSGIDNIVYRGVLADFRYYFCEAFEKQITGEFPGHKDLLRKTKVSGKNKDKITFDEGEAEYVRRALPILAGLRSVDEVKVDEFQPIVERLLSETDEVPGPDGSKLVVPKISFDPSERERAERGPKTLPKIYLGAGEQLVREGKADAFIAYYSLEVKSAPDADETALAKAKAESIGWKIKALEDAERAKTNLAGKYGVPEPATA